MLQEYGTGSCLWRCGWFGLGNRCRPGSFVSSRFHSSWNHRSVIQCVTLLCRANLMFAIQLSKYVLLFSLSCYMGNKLIRSYQHGISILHLGLRLPHTFSSDCQGVLHPNWSRPPRGYGQSIITLKFPPKCNFRKRLFILIVSISRSYSHQSFELIAFGMPRCQYRRNQYQQSMALCY